MQSPGKSVTKKGNVKEKSIYPVLLNAVLLFLTIMLSRLLSFRQTEQNTQHFSKSHQLENEIMMLKLPTIFSAIR